MPFPQFHSVARTRITSTINIHEARHTILKSLHWLKINERKGFTKSLGLGLETFFKVSITRLAISKQWVTGVTAVEDCVR